MKILILLTLSFLGYSNVADITCNLNQPIIIENAFGRLTTFNNAQIDIQNYDGTDSALMIIQDRFGAGYEVFNRLWKTNSRCRSNSICLSTDFSGIRGLTLEIPNSVLEANNQYFTGRFRDNRNFRTYFSSCRSYLR